MTSSSVPPSYYGAVPAKMRNNSVIPPLMLQRSAANLTTDTTTSSSAIKTSATTSMAQQQQQQQQQGPFSITQRLGDFDMLFQKQLDVLTYFLENYVLQNFHDLFSVQTCSLVTPANPHAHHVPNASIVSEYLLRQLDVHINSMQRVLDSMEVQKTQLTPRHPSPMPNTKELDKAIVQFRNDAHVIFYLNHIREAFRTIIETGTALPQEIAEEQRQIIPVLQSQFRMICSMVDQVFASIMPAIIDVMDSRHSIESMIHTHHKLLADSQLNIRAEFYKHVMNITQNKMNVLQDVLNICSDLLTQNDPRNNTKSRLTVSQYDKLVNKFTRHEKTIAVWCDLLKQYSEMQFLYPLLSVRLIELNTWTIGFQKFFIEMVKQIMPHLLTPVTADPPLMARPPSLHRASTTNNTKRHGGGGARGRGENNDYADPGNVAENSVRDASFDAYAAASVRPQDLSPDEAQQFSSINMALRAGQDFLHNAETFDLSNRIVLRGGAIEQQEPQQMDDHVTEIERVHRLLGLTDISNDLRYIVDNASLHARERLRADRERHDAATRRYNEVTDELTQLLKNNPDVDITNDMIHQFNDAAKDAMRGIREKIHATDAVSRQWNLVSRMDFLRAAQASVENEMNELSRSVEGQEQLEDAIERVKAVFQKSSEAEEDEWLSLIVQEENYCTAWQQTERQSNEQYLEFRRVTRAEIDLRLENARSKLQFEIARLLGEAHSQRQNLRHRWQETVRTQSTIISNGRALIKTHIPKLLQLIDDDRTNGGALGRAGSDVVDVIQSMEREVDESIRTHDQASNAYYMIAMQKELIQSAHVIGRIIHDVLQERSTTNNYLEKCDHMCTVLNSIGNAPRPREIIDAMVVPGVTSWTNQIAMYPGAVDGTKLLSSNELARRDAVRFVKAHGYAGEPARVSRAQAALLQTLMHTANVSSAAPSS